ncbi:MAG TPA: GNAT family N-acetyltransferase [Candidatus Acidoferrales bacterium]|nr:GNAT family N-acetyltransferase [Candidatus Acidoferrales bacterium]
MDQIEVRHCASILEFEECVRVEQVTWGEGISVPSAIFVVAHHTGGQVLGAFDREKMIGFTLAIAGARRGKPFLHSHMTAVLPAYRDRGIGRRLKLFQRQDALQRGIEVIEWTFDPLDFKNAHFNFQRLGAVARRYIPDCYGVTASPLHAGLPTDRLVAEWWLDSERVKSILADHAVPVQDRVARISLPSNVDQIRAYDRETALRVQAKARSQFLRWFGEGYVVVAVEPTADTMDYFLASSTAITCLGVPTIDENR